MLTLDARKGTTTAYLFGDESSATEFCKYAEGRYASAMVQFPYDSSGKSRDKKKVLVTGTGSMNHDLFMDKDLKQMVSVLGGEVMPHH